MDHQRILCTYLSLAPTGILTSSTLQVIPTLLRNAYNPEGLARSFVATINRHLFSLKDSMGLQSVNIESVQEYWSNISMGDTSPPLDEGIHDLLSTAYNEVVFAWVTDFLLYPISKRAPQLIPRRRTRPVSQEQTDPITHRQRPRYPLPRRTPPQPTAIHAQDVNQESAPGLDGCKYINVEEEEEQLPTAGNKRRREDDACLEQGLAQWNPLAIHLKHDEDLYGEALQIRTGRYREKLKRDIYRRDGASCAASALGPIDHDNPDEPLFCTQIIPESHDTDRFTRFRKMVSVVFSGQYDDLLEPTNMTDSSEPDHSAGPSPPPRRRSASATQARPENILRHPRNAINLSEKWLRWFDEGRFVIREWGGQFYIRCLDPSLYHDPSFSRQGLHPNDPWERGHGLRLDIGATPIGVTVVPSAHQHQVSGPTAPIPYYHQLPTPVPTPTSPAAPVSPFHEPKRIVLGRTPTMVTVPPPNPMAITVRGAAARHLPRSHHRQGASLPTRHAPSASTSTSHADNGSITQHPQLHESARHPGPFAAGQASRRAYQHSRNASIDSGISPTSTSRHSIKALLNPTPGPSPTKLPPSVVASASASASDAKMIFTPLERGPAPPVRAVRKELWDVDALDPRLTRLHEQIVTMWWDTGLPTEIAVQTQWVDKMPLQEMNVFVLGEQMFAGVLQHKLKLL